MSISYSAKAESKESYITVKQLYDYCLTNEGEFGWAYCFGVVNGVSKSMELSGLNPSIKKANIKLTICYDTAVRLEAEVQAFKNWALQNPKLWYLTDAYGVMLALNQTWPCE